MNKKWYVLSKLYKRVYCSSKTFLINFHLLMNAFYDDPYSGTKF